MSELSPKLLQALATLLDAGPLLVAIVLGVLVGRAVRAAVLLGLDRGRGLPVILARLVAVVGFAAAAVGYATLTAPTMEWGRRPLLGAGAAAGLMVAGVLLRRLLGRPLAPLSLVRALGRATLILAVLLVAALEIMRSGFLALTTDRPVLLVELTGESRPQTVRWANPDQPMTEQTLAAHRVRFRRPDGKLCAETWLYGDQVAVKGRVLRLAPILNVAGIPNLFELQLAHNGYATAERHNTLPHHAEPLPPLGPLAVHPRVQPLRDRILAGWERESQGSDPDTRWAVRAATIESTYFPMVDAGGAALRRTFTLVLGPSGLTAR